MAHYRAHWSAQREDKIFENRRASGERGTASLGFTVTQILRAISVLVTASRRRRATELGAVIRSIVTQASRQLVDSEIDQLLISDVNEQRRRGRHVPLGLLSGALIALPVRVSGVTVGVLAVLSEVPNCFAGGDLVVLQCFGEALGIVESLAGSRGSPVHPR
ncbi:hypothetical protein M2390_001159 [Mycetocola sp. BIGb0189]|nr:hypothetical protein [Mycetocola sp. BIGb0189]